MPLTSASLDADGKMREGGGFPFSSSRTLSSSDLVLDQLVASAQGRHDHHEHGDGLGQEQHGGSGAAQELLCGAGIEGLHHQLQGASDQLQGMADQLQGVSDQGYIYDVMPHQVDRLFSS